MILDSSFLVAMFLSEDGHHKEAVSASLAHKNEKWIICDRVLEETFTVLMYKRGVLFGASAIDLLKQGLGLETCHLHPEEVVQIWENTKMASKKISFIDQVVIYLCKKHNAQPLCFDEQIIKETKSIHKNK